jgi:hypothetical protein
MAFVLYRMKARLKVCLSIIEWETKKGTSADVPFLLLSGL